MLLGLWPLSEGAGSAPEEECSTGGLLLSLMPLCDDDAPVPPEPDVGGGGVRPRQWIHPTQPKRVHHKRRHKDTEEEVLAVLGVL